MADCSSGELLSADRRPRRSQLAKVLGVQKLLVVVNKMDDPSVAGPNGEWCAHGRRGSVVPTARAFRPPAHVLVGSLL